MNKETLFRSALVLAFLGALWNVTAADPWNINNAPTEGNEGSAIMATMTIDPFKLIMVEARTFMVFDIGANGEPRVIAAREAAMQWPLASLTKLMTALVARERLAADAVITVTAADISEYGDDGLLVKERFTRDSLIDIMLLRSSNDAAKAIARHVGEDEFIKMMNDKAKELGMTETYFINSNGLDVSSVVSGAYSSAQDLATLLVYILRRHPQMLEATGQPELVVTSLSGKTHKYENTNKIVDYLPQLIGGKTGLTDIAGGNLAVLVDVGVNHPAGIIALGSSEEARFSDVLTLYNAMVKWFQDYNEGK